ncbi:MAG TPA: hydratase, partial [Firmicutes bacterium]|nr:hydratase [Bacillota bacterium]
DRDVYRKRVYEGFKQADPSVDLKYGPNITDWPQMIPLTDGLILKLAAVITDPVTTTDELIPSGDTSSYRSNPLKLAEYTLSRKDPDYVPKAKAFACLEQERRGWADGKPLASELKELFRAAAAVTGETAEKIIGVTGLGSAIFAVKPGDGSAREQAASCQKVLGGWANIALEYATKRYRSNVINWGMIPFTIDPADQEKITPDTVLYIPQIGAAVRSGADQVQAYLLPKGTPVQLRLENLTAEERKIILAGSLINHYAN